MGEPSSEEGRHGADERNGGSTSIWEDAARRNEFWDGRFSAEEYVYGTEPNDFLREVGRRIPD